MHYRNWSAICALKDTDHHMMMAFALLDLSSEFGQDVARRFPEYFATEPYKNSDPIPKSMIIAVAVEDNIQMHGSDMESPAEWASIALKEFDIPDFEYSLTEEAVAEWGAPLIPDELRAARKQWDVVMFQGRQLVCVEYNNRPGVDLVNFAPAERIDLTC